jgi:hemolysin activation/secretion protein
MRRSVICIITLQVLLPGSSAAQEVPSAPLDLPDNIFREIIDLPERAGDQRQDFPEVPLENPQQPPPALPLPPPPPPPDDRLSGALQVQVSKIKITGNSVFTDEELAPLIKPYEGRAVNTEELFALRNALTTFYINAGYINSGAIIPDQKVVDGVIEIQIVEGTLTEINVSGDNWLRDSYITSRLEIGNEEILNINQLQERIKLIQQDQLVERINAELTPGTNPGESILNLKVDESRFYNFGVAFNNYRNPSIGELQGEFYAAVYNLTGFGDELSARYSLSGGLDTVFAAYSIPITPYDTRLRLYYEQNDAQVIEEPFDILNIQSVNKNFGISLSHPFYHTPKNQLLGSIAFERRRSDVTFQLPGAPREPFPTLAEDGKTRISVLRFLQEWVHRSSSTVIAMRSTFNWGIDVSPLLAPNNVRINDDQFFFWLGQFQWVQRLGSTDIQVVLRTDLQLTPDSLLPIEKFTVGGAVTVRGYRENQMIRDNGAVASIEVRVPVFRLPIPWLSQSPAEGMVQLAGFYDFGWAKNTLEVDSNRANTISSAGIGVRWDPTPKIHGELYWAIPFRNVSIGEDNSLQDHGITFFLNVDIF